MNSKTKLFQIHKITIAILLLTISATTFGQNESSGDDTQQKKERKAKKSFKLSGGVNFNYLLLDSDSDVESEPALGYNFGVSFKSGRFFYYEVGARINSRSFDIVDESSGTSMTNTATISALDLPITGGINLTSFADRLVGVRIFVSAIPSFTVGKKVDDIGLNDNDINGFMFYGQGGIGIDIALVFIEIGVNYGFDNIVKDIENESIKSNPSQVFLNLGFRF